MVVEGALEGPDRVSPGGQRCAAWLAWFDDGEERSLGDPCIDVTVSDIFVVQGGARLAISRSFFESVAYMSGPYPYVDVEIEDERWRRQLQTSHPRAELFPGSASVLIDAGPLLVSKHVPSLFAARCAPARPGSYVEACLPASAAIEVSGCRVGDAIQKCGDGLDALSIRELHSKLSTACVDLPQRNDSARGEALSTLRAGSRFLAGVLFPFGGLWLVFFRRERRATKRSPDAIEDGPYRTSPIGARSPAATEWPSILVVTTTLGTAALAVIATTLWR
jgi:hypothetical protein